MSRTSRLQATLPSDLTNVNGTLYFSRHSKVGGVAQRRIVEVGWDRRRNRGGQGLVWLFGSPLDLTNVDGTLYFEVTTPRTAKSYGSRTGPPPEQ